MTKKDLSIEPNEGLDVGDEIILRDHSGRDYKYRVVAAYRFPGRSSKLRQIRVLEDEVARLKERTKELKERIKELDHEIDRVGRGPYAD